MGRGNTSERLPIEAERPADAGVILFEAFLAEATRRLLAAGWEHGNRTTSGGRPLSQDFDIKRDEFICLTVERDAAAMRLRLVLRRTGPNDVFPRKVMRVHDHLGAFDEGSALAQIDAIIKAVRRRPGN